MDAEQSVTALSKDDVSRLLAFHTAHFPHQAPPQLSEAHLSIEEEGEDNKLGYYDDGIKRTLTDEQVKMFRHSEVQRILQERRWRAEDSEEGVEMATSRESGEQKSVKEPGSKGNAENASGDKVPKDFHFYDEPAERDARNITLSYGDEQGEHDARAPKERKFLWPKLGSGA